mgnify:CR=1 FL=1
MEYTENMTFEEASHALMKDLKTRLADLHEHFDAENVDWYKLHLPLAKLVSEETQKSLVSPEVVEVRPKELECDVVRYQNNKEKWVALVGLLNGHPYEIFTGLQDEDEGIMLPKSVTKGKIIKTVLSEGQKRYDFQFVNKRGYKITVEGLREVQSRVLELCQAHLRRSALSYADCPRHQAGQSAAAHLRNPQHLAGRRGKSLEEVPL